MKTFLKIKLKHLAAEARINAHERRKWTKRAQRGIDKAAALGTKQTKKAWLGADIHQHRIDRIRPEARATQLAYGFLRGLSYHQIERHCYTAPDWAKIARMVADYNKWPRHVGQKSNELNAYFGDSELKERFAAFQADGARCLKQRQPRAASGVKRKHKTYGEWVGSQTLVS